MIIEAITNLFIGLVIFILAAICTYVVVKTKKES